MAIYYLISMLIWIRLNEVRKAVCIEKHITRNDPAGVPLTARDAEIDIVLIQSSNSS